MTPYLAKVDAFTRLRIMMIGYIRESFFDVACMCLGRSLDGS